MAFPTAVNAQVTDAVAETPGENAESHAHEAAEAESEESAEAG